MLQFDGRHSKIFKRNVELWPEYCFHILRGWYEQEEVIIKLHSCACLAPICRSWRVSRGSPKCATASRRIDFPCSLKIWGDHKISFLETQKWFFSFLGFSRDPNLATNSRKARSQSSICKYQDICMFKKIEIVADQSNVCSRNVSEWKTIETVTHI